MMHKFSALQSFSLANLILAVLTGVAVAQTQSEDDVDEDKPDFGELVDLAEERPEVRDLMDFHGGPDADLYGAWSVAARWPIVAIHAALLPDGDVLTYGTNEYAENGQGFVYDRWRPERGLAPASHFTLDVETSNNLFCSAQAVVPGTGGLVLVTGGSVEKNGQRNFGSNAVNVFDPVDNSFFQPVDNMKYERWYPTVTQLSDGRILVHGGRAAKKTPTLIPEIFDPVGGKWKRMTGAKSEEVYGLSSWNYPRSFMAPNGDVLIMPVGQKNAYYMDTQGRGSVRNVGELPIRTKSSNHLAVMYAPGQILSIRGTDATRLTIDGSDQIQVDDLPDIATPRWWADATILANGEVMVSGGATVNQSLDDAVKYVELFDPETETWRLGAASEKSRLYHSTSLLLPNGTVLCAGGGPPGPTANLNAEIYYPPYLFTKSGSLRKRPRLLGEVANGGSVIKIRAAGDEGTELMEVRINGKAVATFEVSAGFGMYTCVTDKPVTGDQVQVAFINDDFDPLEGIDSNLTVDYITIDGVKYQTENRSVLCVEEDVPGFVESETLYHNGYFEFWQKPAGPLQLGTVPYGTTLDVFIDRARTIEKVMLIRFGSVTHSFDMGQRAMELDFHQSNGSITIDLPSVRKIAPPGHYMIFLINDVGTPSEAAIVELD